MTVTVTENPVPILQIWDVPPNAQGRGIPNGQLVWQNNAVVIPATTAEKIVISINTAQPLGYVYRLVEARIMLSLAAKGDDQFGRIAEGQIVAFNPASPGESINIPFALGSSTMGEALDDLIPTRVANSALSFRMFYGPIVPLPNTPFQARSATTVVRFFLAADDDTSLAGALSYYIRCLRYSIEDGERWAIHSPVPVTG